MTIWKRKVSLVCLAICLALLSGCWDRKELDEMALVTGLGVDLTENGMVNLTMQISKPDVESGGSGGGGLGDSSEGGGGGGKGSNFLVTQKAANGINQSLREFFNIYSRQVFLEHKQVIVFGREMAEHGLIEWFDFFARDNETRLDVLMFVADGTAHEVLSLTPPIEKLPSEHLVRLEANQRLTSEGYTTDLLTVMQEMLCKSQATAIGYVTIVDDSGTTSISLAGLAVLKRGRMVGVMDEKETFGYRLLKNEVTDGLIPVYTPHGAAFLEVESSKTKIKITFDGDIPHANVKIIQHVSLSELRGHTTLSLQELNNVIIEHAKAVVVDFVASSFWKAKELNADIFSFAHSIYTHNFKKWKEIQHRWDELFPQMTMDIEVDLRMDTVGRIVRMRNESVVLTIV